MKLQQDWTFLVEVPRCVEEYNVAVSINTNCSSMFTAAKVDVSRRLASVNVPTTGQVPQTAVSAPRDSTVLIVLLPTRPLMLSLMIRA